MHLRNVWYQAGRHIIMNPYNTLCPTTDRLMMYIVVVFFLPAENKLVTERQNFILVHIESNCRPENNCGSNIEICSWKCRNNYMFQTR